ncbi:helix-turn-helix transcriptional regulator [Rhizobium cauense]|uniref:ArsR/SmtB family transcription factor n=1 Tax=Rhizobium cauense TaxID=1166683 RepID=UPI001C6E1D25|nr:metalloregulator ArsR/SmtB family transcription factor [Rhizobium cauense]MBW9113511.1 helix-turn-helix transcriptional regulator [Rhizobium cauense]
MDSDSPMEDEVRLLALLANEKRLLIACHLLRGECSVSDLAEKVGLSQSAVSQHLAIFHAAKIVTTRRDAQTIYYSTSDYGIRRLLEAVKLTFVQPA